MTSRCLAFFLVGLLVAPLAADTNRGDAQLDAYFRHQTKLIADSTLADIRTLAQWEQKRPELRRQFLEMMSLWPLPPRTDLRPVVTGRLEQEKYTVEKLHFQSVPGLYVTGNLYLPRNALQPAPAVLYVCGHGPSIIDKVSYGNKVTYQHHAIWLAEHGYVCLVVDTLQLGELQGLHHGTHNLGMWWWQALGYTPAGIECWNGIRALDYLQSRKEVDPRRLAVTGRSGGGATSWWVAAADDRVQAIIPVAGIADLHAHVVEGEIPRFRKGGVVSGHCDCMYFVNTYRWDFATVAALCAPRALMLGNSDEDGIFPVPGYRRLAEKVRPIYDLYKAADKFVLLETAGPHKDTPELRLGAYRWLNRWLREETSEIEEREALRFSPAQLKVFDRPPSDALNATIHETFLKPVRIEIPQSPQVVRSWWEGKSVELKQLLQEKTFRGWAQQPVPLNSRLASEVLHEGVRLRCWDFTSETGVDLRLWVLTSQQTKTPTRITLRAIDEVEWQGWARNLGPSFSEAFQFTQASHFNFEKFKQVRESLQTNKSAVALVAPRGIGPTRWSEVGTPADNHVRRRYALIGQTLDGQRVWDVRRAIACMKDIPDLNSVPLGLEGNREMAGVVLYAGVFEPSVAQFDLWHLPPTHAQAPTFLNIRRILDTPQAVSLLAPRPVRLHVRGKEEAKSWAFPLQLQQSLGRDFVKIQTVGDY